MTSGSRHFVIRDARIADLQLWPPACRPQRVESSGPSASEDWMLAGSGVSLYSGSPAHVTLIEFGVIMPLTWLRMSWRSDSGSREEGFTPLATPGATLGATAPAP